MRLRVVAGMLWMLGERMSAQLINMVVQIVLARLLLPEEYGVVAIAAVFVTFSNILATSGLSMALVQKRDADNIDFSTAFFMNLGFSALLYVLVFVMAPAIGEAYGNQDLIMLLRVMGLTIPVRAVNSVQRSFVSRNMLFTRFFVSTLISNALSGVAGVVAALLGWGVWALALQSCLAALLDFAVLWATVKWRPQWCFSLDRFKGLFSFGWKVLVSNVLYEAFRQGRALVIGKVYSVSDLAFYNRGESVPAIISVNLDSAMQSVLLPVMSKAQDDCGKVLAYLRKTVTVGCFVLFPAMAGLAAVAETLVEVLLTGKWLPSVPFIWIFCISYAFQSVQAGCLQAIRAVGRSDVALGQDFIKRGLDLIMLLVAVPHGVYAIAFASLLGSFIATAINYVPCAKLFGYRLFDLARDIIPNMIAALLMALVVRLLLFLELPALPMLLLQVVVGALAYLLLSMLFRLEGFVFVSQVVKEVLQKGGRAA